MNQLTPLPLLPSPTSWSKMKRDQEMKSCCYKKDLVTSWSKLKRDQEMKSPWCKKDLMTSWSKLLQRDQEMKSCCCKKDLVSIWFHTIRTRWNRYAIATHTMESLRVKQ